MDEVGVVEVQRGMEGDNLKEYNRFKEVMEVLNREEPGLLVLDSDWTIREPQRAIAQGKPGMVPDEVLMWVDKLKDRGWQILVATNQYYEKKGGGHQVARFLSGKKGYPAFPACFEERGIEIVGGGWGFVGMHSKDTRKYREKVWNWIKHARWAFDGGSPVLHFVGNSDIDVRLFRYLASENDRSGEGIEMRGYKLPRDSEAVIGDVKSVAAKLRGAQMKA